MRGYFNEKRIEHDVMKGEMGIMEQEVLNRAGNQGQSRGRRKRKSKMKDFLNNSNKSLLL